MAFSLNCYPVMYRAQHKQGQWNGEYLEKPHETPSSEASMPDNQRDELAASRNFFDDMPFVNATTQYGLSCFEGMKALPQKDGGLAIFRPDRNAERFFNSMNGLYMHPFPQDTFIKASIETVKRNAALGFRPQFKPEWEKDSFMTAQSIYMRPFTYTESGIDLSVSKETWVVIATTPVGSFFPASNAGAVVTERIRATPKGTGWIKAASNYVSSILAKHEAQKSGFVECIFLDSVHHKYIEECSSCNILFYLKSGKLVSPELGDTILPGITRASILELARDGGTETEERKISIEEVLDDTKECFVCGTAVGVSPLTSITYKGKQVVFNGGKTGEFTTSMRNTLKGIQYGTIPDTKGWLTRVTE